MTDCIYTGAYIYITNYNAYAPADIFHVRNCLALRINPQQHWTYEPDFPVTHVLTLPLYERDYFWASDTSLTFTAVVPLDACPRTENARPILEP